MRRVAQRPAIDVQKELIHISGRRRFLERYNGRKWHWLQDSKKFLLLVAVLFLLCRFVVGFSVISGNSMLTTLHSGDVVVYTRVGNRIERGDIIALSLPSGEYYVKRVVALGGDVVDVRGGALYVNGAAESGDYVRGNTYPEAGSFTYPYTVPQGDVFTLGDNREESIDSRFYGSVNLRQVKGVLRLHIGRFFIRLM